MTSFALHRYAFSVSAACALLAGCGGSQPPIGAPDAMAENGFGEHSIQSIRRFLRLPGFISTSMCLSTSRK